MLVLPYNPELCMICQMCSVETTSGSKSEKFGSKGLEQDLSRTEIGLNMDKTRSKIRPELGLERLGLNKC